MKIVLIFFAIPFATILLSVLLICAVCVSPFFLIGYMYSTRERKERRSDKFYPKQKIDLKSMIENYKNRKL